MKSLKNGIIVALALGVCLVLPIITGCGNGDQNKPGKISAADKLSFTGDPSKPMPAEALDGMKKADALRAAAASRGIPGPQAAPSTPPTAGH